MDERLDRTDGEEKSGKTKRVVHSLSMGEYYGMRMAHTHREKLAGAVSTGGWRHRDFGREWLDGRFRTFIPSGIHMGEPAVVGVILEWIKKLLGNRNQPKTSMHTSESIPHTERTG